MKQLFAELDTWQKFALGALPVLLILSWGLVFGAIKEREAREARNVPLVSTVRQ